MKTNRKSAIIILLAAIVSLVEVANAFYDPGLQRWINRDPIQERGGLNLFAFVINSPLQTIDFFGLEFLVDPKCKNDFEKAKNYLSKSDIAKEMIDQMDKSATKYHIDHGSGDDMYNKETKRVKWNPRQALETTAGEGQSPSLGLLHELRHALENGENEDQVINFENSCAKQLGEGTRKNHGDYKQTFNVDDPTKFGPIPPKKPLPPEEKPPGIPFPK